MPIGENVSIRWIANVTSSLLKNFNYRRRLDSPQTHYHYFQPTKSITPGNEVPHSYFQSREKSRWMNLNRLRSAGCCRSIRIFQSKEKRRSASPSRLTHTVTITRSKYRRA